MIKITFILLDLQTGKHRRCSRKIDRSEFLSWLDREGQVETVRGKIVRLVDLQKHVFIQHV
jgi:hypothetical protein